MKAVNFRGPPPLKIDAETVKKILPGKTNKLTVSGKNIPQCAGGCAPRTPCICGGSAPTPPYLSGLHKNLERQEEIEVKFYAPTLNFKNSYFLRSWSPGTIKIVISVKFCVYWTLFDVDVMIFWKFHIPDFDRQQLTFFEVLEPWDHQNRNQREILRIKNPCSLENDGL